MKRLPLLVLTLVAASVILFVLFRPPKRGKPVEPVFQQGIDITRNGYSASKPTDQQAKCLDRSPAPACFLQPDQSRKMSAETGAPTTMSADETITYHNDGASGGDESVHTFLKTFFLDKTQGPSTYYQHTHGTHHLLSVMTKRRQPGRDTCERVDFAYRLEAKDQILFYYAAVGAPMDYQKIDSGAIPPNMVVERVERPESHEHVQCSHVSGVKLTNQFWRFEMKSQQAWSGSRNRFNLPETQEEIVATTDAQPVYLRRILVKRHGQPVYYIHLDSGCSAWSLCTRVADSECDTVPLCRIDLPEKNPNCACCAIPGESQYNPRSSAP